MTIEKLYKSTRGRCADDEKGIDVFACDDSIADVHSMFRV